MLIVLMPICHHGSQNGIMHGISVSGQGMIRLVIVPNNSRLVGQRQSTKSAVYEIVVSLQNPLVNIIVIVEIEQDISGVGDPSAGPL